MATGSDLELIEANKPPTTRQLLSFVIPKVATRWYELGVMLLRPEQEPRLQQIKSDHGDNVRKSCLEMFTYWRRSHPDDNWNHLVAALKSPGLEMDAVAADLQKMFTAITIGKDQTSLQTNVEEAKSEDKRNITCPAYYSVLFSSLVETVLNILSKLDNKEETLERAKSLCICLTIGSESKTLLFDDEKLKKITDCANFRELFVILRAHWNWDECSILEGIVEKCESEKAQQELHKYRQKVVITKGLEVIFNQVKVSPPTGYKRFYVIYKTSSTRLTTDQYLDCKKFIFDTLEVHQYVALPYSWVLFGSLHLEWHVTAQAVPYMMVMAYKKKQVFIDNSYVFMQLGVVPIYDMRDTHEEEKSPSITSGSHHTVSTPLDDESCNIEHDVLKECAVSFTNKLDASAIFPHLTAHHLLSEDDKLVLISTLRTPREKAKHIMSILPQKTDGWFDKLLLCLRESVDGTNHGDLWRELEQKQKELRQTKSTGTPKNIDISIKEESEESHRPAGDEENKPFSIFVTSAISHKHIVLQVRPSDTVGRLMDLVRKKFIMPDVFSLISGSQELRLNNSLRDSNIKSNSRVMIVIRIPGGVFS